MRTLLIAALAMCLGVAVGWGATRLEFKPVKTSDVPKADIKSNDAYATVEVEGGETFDFGSMDANTTMRHEFVFVNRGTAPLTLTAGKTSCKCTISDVDSGPVAPGQSRIVQLEWTPKELGDRFQQTASIHTNDPTRPTIDLTIRGKVRDSISIEPTHLVWGEVPSSAGATQQLKIWSFNDEPLNYSAFSVSAPEAAEHYEVHAQPMDQKTLEEKAGAKSGLLLNITLKAGVPLGLLHHTLKIEHSYTERAPFEFPVSGRSVGDITIIAKDYDHERDYVGIGNVASSQGRKTSAFLLVKGPHREEVKFTVKSIDPESSLQVELGEPKISAKTVTWPLSIEVPPGASPVNRLGSELGRLARIEFETQHPDIPMFTLKLRFAVTEE